MNDTTPQTSAPEAQNDRNRVGLSTWLLWFSLILTLYVLSTGPVMKITFHGSPYPPPAVLAFYAPLDVLANNCPPVAAFFRWYLVTLWRIDTP